MAEETLPRFQHLDDNQLQDLINSANSKNTKREGNILNKNIRRLGLGLDLGYLQVINTDLDSVNKLPNSELENVDLG